LDGKLKSARQGRIVRAGRESYGQLPSLSSWLSIELEKKEIGKWKPSRAQQNIQDSFLNTKHEKNGTNITIFWSAA